MRRKLTSNLNLTTPIEERAKLLLSKAGIVYYFALLNPGCTTKQVFDTLPECFPNKHHQKQGISEIRGYAYALSKMYLFDLGSEYSTHLKEGVVNTALAEAFNKNERPVSNNAKISKKDERCYNRRGVRIQIWEIVDTNNTYIIKDNDKKLKIYLKIGLLELKDSSTLKDNKKQLLLFADPSFLVESYLAQRNITNPKLKEWLTDLVKENAKHIFGFEYSTEILQPYYLYGHRGFTEFKEHNAFEHLDGYYNFNSCTDNLKKVKIRRGYYPPGTRGDMGSSIDENSAFFFRYLFGGLGRPEHPVIAYDAALETLHYFFRFACTLWRELSAYWIYMSPPEAEEIDIDTRALAIERDLRKEFKVPNEYRAVIRVAFSPYLTQILKPKTGESRFKGENGAFMGRPLHPLVLFWDRFEKDYAFSFKFFNILAKDCLAEAELINNRYIAQQFPNSRKYFSRYEIENANKLLEYTKEQYDEVKQYSRLLNKFVDLRRKKKHHDAANLFVPLAKKQSEVILKKYAKGTPEKLSYYAWVAEHSVE